MDTGQGFTLSNPFVAVYDQSGNLLDSNDDSGPNRNALLEFRATYSGKFFIAASSSGGTGTGTYRISYQLATRHPATAVGFWAATTTVWRHPNKIKVGQTAQGFIGPKGDDDWFRIKLQPGTYTAGARNFNTDLPFRVDAYIFDLTGALFSGQANRYDVNEEGEIGSNNVFTITEAGTYYVDVREETDLRAGQYRITVGTYVV